MKKVLGIIPARYASSRFPGKPLVDIFGKPMIQHVYERAERAIQNVVVATDDRQIFEAVRKFKGEVVMTSSDHKTGTDRCVEALNITEEKKDVKYDIVMNIQGDEPQLRIKQLLELINCFDDPKTQIATLIKRFQQTEQLFNPNNVKVIFNLSDEAIYFSRTVIPYINKVKNTSEWLSHFNFFKHIGIYAFKPDILRKLSRLPSSSIELAETLEQNRWIENGFQIKLRKTELENIGIDTPGDLQELMNDKNWLNEF